MALVAVLVLWPFLDTKDEVNILKRPLLLALFVLSLIIWAALTVWGRYS
jgi:quinol-cytochrome oxidoreductase complex cytochrome b subunit